ncbi:hypothetical protein ACGFR8_20450 [Streptomyces brevispora]|uniref:hypothetical protein n=1 Tax=Streptomyces brevispora TaxID=887462 RepID=UPI0037217261
MGEFQELVQVMCRFQSAQAGGGQQHGGDRELRRRVVWCGFQEGGDAAGHGFGGASTPEDSERRCGVAAV